MNYADIKTLDIANGPGCRTTLFVSGCRNRCPGCFNSEAWDFRFGKPYTEKTEEYLLETLAPDYVTGLTILGGEPFEPENQPVVQHLVDAVNESFPEKTIWCFTGYVFEDLIRKGAPKNTEYTLPLLDGIDVLVDGPYIEAQSDITLRFRGSSNQRIIDVQKSLAEEHTILWQDTPYMSPEWYNPTN